MKTLPLSEAKAQLSRLVDAVASRDEQIVITRNGRPAAMIISPDEFEGWAATIEILQDPAMMTEIERGLRALDEGRVLSDREIEELFDLAPGEAQRGVPKSVLRKRSPTRRRAKAR